MVENGRAVDSTEAAGLDPRVRKMSQAVHPEKQHAADRRRQPPLMGREQPQGFEVAARQLPNRGKELGSRSEVQSFRVQRRQRLLIERLAASEALHFRDEQRIGHSNSRVLPSGLRNVSTRSIARKCTLKQRSAPCFRVLFPKRWMRRAEMRCPRPARRLTQRLRPDHGNISGRSWSRFRRWPDAPYRFRIRSRRTASSLRVRRCWG